jgi:hypothetical protein
MPFKKKNILVLIIGAGFILRLLGLVNISLGGDFEYHWSVAGSIVHRKDLPILGPGASINPEFHLGPFYYYFLAIPYLLGAGNYKIAIIFFSLFNSLSIIYLYKLSREWFDDKRSLIVCALFAFSSYMITVGNFPWNAYLVPSFVILILYFLIKIKRGSLDYVVPLGLIYSLALQIHTTVIFLAPLILLNIPFRKIRLKTMFFSLGLFMIVLAPWLLTEAGSGFNQTKQIISSIYAPGIQECNFREWLVSHGHGERCFHYFRNTIFIFRLFSMSLFANTGISIVIFTAVFSLYTLFKTKHPQKKFFIAWLFSVFFLYLFYPANIYLHYMLILVPLPFFIMVLFLQGIERLKNGKVFSNLIYILFMINNVVNYLVSLGMTRS